MLCQLLNRCGWTAIVVGSLTTGASAQNYLIMPDSTNNRTVLFDPFNGALINNNYFALTPSSTPVEAIQVGSEIWVSTQLGDRIERYTLGGAPISNITGAYDNVRGITLIGNTVYMTNDGIGNGAPGPSVHRFDMAGNPLGFTLTPATTGPFDVLAYGNNMLVSSDAANDDIHQYTLAGASVGTFHNTTSLNFAEQMDYDPAGNILVAGFSSNNVATLNFNTGALVSSFAAPGARGVNQLGNGNIMWTSGAGAFVYDINTQTSTQVYAGGGRFLSLVSVPAPGALAMLGLAGLLGSPRRRRH
jgi:hypothetical protein